MEQNNSHIANGFASILNNLNFASDAQQNSYLRRQKYVHFFPISENVFQTQRPTKTTFEQRLHDKCKNPVYVGVAGIANFEMMFVTHAVAAVLVDINPNQKVMWDRVFEVIKHNPERKEALKQLGSLDLMMLMPTRRESADEYKGKWQSTLNEPESNIRSVGSPQNFIEAINSFSLNPNSWLGSDERYAYIREMVLQDAIATSNVDMNNSTQMKNLGTAIRNSMDKHGIADAPILAYISNIPTFLQKKDFLHRRLKNPKESFAEGLSYVLKPNDVVVLSSKRTWSEEPEVSTTAMLGLRPSIMPFSFLQKHLIKEAAASI